MKLKLNQHTPEQIKEICDGLMERAKERMLPQGYRLVSTGHKGWQVCLAKNTQYEGEDMVHVVDPLMNMQTYYTPSEFEEFYSEVTTA